MKRGADEKKISIVTIINDLSIGGAEVIAADIARTLDTRDFEMRIICLKEKKSAGGPDLAAGLGTAGITVEYLNTRGFWKTIFALRSRFRQLRPRIIHCHLPLSVIIGTIAGRLAGISSIIAHHHNTRAFNSPRINFLLRLLDPIVSLHICYAESVQREIFGKEVIITAPVTVLREHSCTVHNFVDTAAIDAAGAGDRQVLRARLHISSGDIAILSVARLLDWKGQDVLIEAMSRLKNGASVRLFIAGDGPMRPALTALTHKLNLETRVIFLGNRADVYALMAVSDIFALPLIYKEAAETKESVGVASLEAMAAGLPVVISDYPSAHKFVRHRENAMMVRPGDSEELAAVLSELCTDPALRAHLGKSARTFIQTNLSLQSMIGIYESIYRTLAV